MIAYSIPKVNSYAIIFTIVKSKKPYKIKVFYVLMFDKYLKNSLILTWGKDLDGLLKKLFESSIK